MQRAEITFDIPVQSVYMRTVYVNQVTLLLVSRTCTSAGSDFIVLAVFFILAVIYPSDCSYIY
jgi:hypothetical protein